MKTLTKVKLINWHTFSNTEFEIYKNALITGENGTGKSTILDAIQYVLTVGKCKFNKAASDIGNRTLESYIRCKTGIEGHEYVRNGDVTTYIVLEFFDEKTKDYQIIGTVIDLPSGGRLNREFFQILDSQINDVTFIEERKVLTKKEFKNTLNTHNQQGFFKDTIKEGERLFGNALGVKLKYFDLVTRALAFKAIDNVYQFIVDFLLKEDFVDIQNLRDSIKHYKVLEEKLKMSKKECDTLEEVIQFYNQYLENAFQIDVLDCTKEKLYERELRSLIENSQKRYQAIEDQLKFIQQKLNQFHQDEESYQEKYHQLDQSLRENDTYNLKNDLKKECERLKKEKEDKQKEYMDLLDELQQEAKLLKELRMQKAFIKAIENEEYHTETLSTHLRKVEQEIIEKTNKTEYQRSSLQLEITKNVEQYNQYQEEYTSLKENQLYYRKEIQELICLLNEQLTKHFGKSIEIKPLCEYIEVKDEKWRNALEGYLNSQRFDLIVEPEYFEYALLVYEEYKNKRGIYGVGIVDVAKLAKYGDVVLKETLADQLECKNTYARWYVNMLLSKVHCVDDVTQLRNYPTAITPTCMLYKNYTARALNPRIYNKPYIGLGAIKIQLKTIEQQLETLQQEIKQQKVKLEALKNTQSLLKKSNADKILYRIDLLDKYHSLEKEYQEVNERYQKLELDDSIISLQEECETVKKLLDQTKKEKENALMKKGSLENNLETFKEQLEQTQESYDVLHEKIIQFEMDHLELSQKADQKVIVYLKRFVKDFKSMKNEIDYQKSVSQDKARQVESQIEMKMKDYNNEYNIGFENSLKDIESYKHRFHQLKDMDIVSKEEKTRQAKLKCEESFKTSFISGLNEKIENAKKDIYELNKGLAQRDFNGETYEFCVSPTSRDDFKEYYKIIQSGKEYMANNLLSETLNENQRRIMDELFIKLSSVENDQETEKMLLEYTDYRNYLDYDIKIKYNSGDFAYFSKVNKEKSGGETQTPFYVIMAASFEQVVRNRNQNEGFGCVVIFDEAFNNMDEQRIQEMIKFYNEREIQTFIAVPPSRASTIIPYVNTRLLVIKQNQHSFVEGFRDEEL
ncbi:ATP-binding protein [Faecalibacillus faecis]|uniref:ATP-binding protein n=1 Tax=Faecalibacillus faecis TaxID=1982628 RepID=UPI0022E2DD13|nr:SbcC/MukB-like Walker B domain-containing protein [Faecalibacillus faecis]